MAIGGPAAKLEQLRCEARSNGCEWLGSALQDIKRDEVRELARAAGLRVKNEDKVWISVGELRAALLEHLAPERAAASEELARDLLFCFLLVLVDTVKQLVNMSSSVVIVVVMFFCFYVFFSVFLCVL